MHSAPYGRVHPLPSSLSWERLIPGAFPRPQHQQTNQRGECCRKCSHVCTLLSPCNPVNQTLLAIFALAIGTLVAFNATRDRTDREMRELRTEVEVLATAAGLDILAQIGTMPFDAVTVVNPAANRSELTPLPFPTGTAYNAITDIDDAHGMAPMAYSSETGGLPLSIGAEVVYVSETDLITPSAIPTFAKAVTIRVSHPMLGDTLDLTQTFTYP